jgi:hypothetical protein
MKIVIAYLIMALLLLALGTGLYKPKRWQDLPDKQVKIMKLGCYFGFLVIIASIARKFI